MKDNDSEKIFENYIVGGMTMQMDEAGVLPGESGQDVAGPSLGYAAAERGAEMTLNQLADQIERDPNFFTTGLAMLKEIPQLSDLTPEAAVKMLRALSNVLGSTAVQSRQRAKWETNRGTEATLRAHGVEGSTKELPPEQQP